MSLNRVTKKDPCRACQRPDWCMQDEYRTLCMRAESPHPLTLKSGEIGWWHKFGEAPKGWRPPVKVPEPPKVDGLPLMRRWQSQTKPEFIRGHAEQLGVKAYALIEMGVAWASEEEAFAWPMRNSTGNIQGIRLRSVDGKKWSVTGAGSGIFLPWCEPQMTVFLPEGPTDTAALLSLNLYAIGRPSNSGGVNELNATIKRLGIRRAVVLSDNDEDKFRPDGSMYNPGHDGAVRLSEQLEIPNCIITLPTKDSREFLGAGGTREMLESLTLNCIWRNP